MVRTLVLEERSPRRSPVPAGRRVMKFLIADLPLSFDRAYARFSLQIRQDAVQGTGRGCDRDDASRVGGMVAGDADCRQGQRETAERGGRE